MHPEALYLYLFFFFFIVKLHNVLVLLIDMLEYYNFERWRDCCLLILEPWPRNYTSKLVNNNIIINNTAYIVIAEQSLCGKL